VLYCVAVVAQSFEHVLRLSFWVVNRQCSDPTFSATFAAMILNEVGSGCNAIMLLQPRELVCQPAPDRCVLCCVDTQ
jgi:energy-converting hydrogenase Eha subunit B